MRSDLQTLDELFKKDLFKIPDYQRGYAWGERQIHDFWNDLIELEEDKVHYIGVLYLDIVKKNVSTQWLDDYWIIKTLGYTANYVVDGQQRLTTSILLIQAILNIARERENGYKVHIAEQKLEEIEKTFICRKRANSTHKTYLFGYDVDNPSHYYLIKHIFKHHISSGYRNEETVYTQNLSFALNFFEEKLRALELIEIENIFIKLTQKFKFNTFTINKDIDVYSAFETINNRGKRLSLLELLKNRLISMSTKISNPSNNQILEQEKEKLKINIHDTWKSVFDYLGKIDNSALTDELFLEAFASKLSESWERIAYNKLINSGKFRRYFRPSKMELLETYLLEIKFNYRTDPNKLDIHYINEYTKDLTKNVELWFHLLNPKSSKFSESEVYWLEKFRRFGDSDLYIQIFCKYDKVKIKGLFSSAEEMFVEYLQNLEKDVFLRSFDSPRTINRGLS